MKHLLHIRRDSSISVHQAHRFLFGGGRGGGEGCFWCELVFEGGVELVGWISVPNKFKYAAGTGGVMCTYLTIYIYLNAKCVGNGIMAGRK